MTSFCLRGATVLDESGEFAGPVDVVVSEHLTTYGHPPAGMFGVGHGIPLAKSISVADHRCSPVDTAGRHPRL